MNIKTKRILAALIDMVGLPIIMGMTGGMVVVIANISDPLRQRLLESLNLVFSLIFWRDFVYSPGRHLFGIEFSSGVEEGGGGIKEETAFTAFTVFCLREISVRVIGEGFFDRAGSISQGESGH